jgi:hypothetical protein
MKFLISSLDGKWNRRIYENSLYIGNENVLLYPIRIIWQRRFDNVITF